MLNYFAAVDKSNILHVALLVWSGLVFSLKKVKNSLLSDIYLGDNANLAESRPTWGEF